MIALHGYWRSGASWRVRIALGLKGLAYALVAHDLRNQAQHDPAYRALAPHGLVPALETGDGVIIQSLAILEWLEERYPSAPLLPADPAGRAAVRAMAGVICCDTHPLHNLRVLQALRRDLGASEAQVSAWIARWIGEGLEAFDALVARQEGAFCHGDAPGMADCCLVPQLYAARRFGVDCTPWPRLLAIEARCLELPAFASADPALQPDADKLAP